MQGRLCSVKKYRALVRGRPTHKVTKALNLCTPGIVWNRASKQDMEWAFAQPDNTFNLKITVDAFEAALRELGIGPPTIKRITRERK